MYMDLLTLNWKEHLHKCAFMWWPQHFYRTDLCPFLSLNNFAHLALERWNQLAICCQYYKDVWLSLNALMFFSLSGRIDFLLYFFAPDMYHETPYYKILLSYIPVLAVLIYSTDNFYWNIKNGSIYICFT